MATRAVRMPIDLEARPQRRFEERIALRFPRLRAFLGKLVWRMPNTRLRRGILRRAVKLAWEALNRGDLEVCFALYHRDCVSVWPPEFAAIGLPAGTVGLEERVREQRRVLDDWDDFHFELHEYIDLGDGRLLTVGRMKAVGQQSGVAVDTEWTALVTTRDGQVVHERLFADNDEALAAVGLEPSSRSTGR